MSDEDNEAAREWRRLLDETRESVRPHVNAMVQGMQQAYTAAAQLAGDPLTSENERFWQIAGNLFVASNRQLDPTGPEVADLVRLSKALPITSTLDEWGSSYAICNRHFDELDGGEELGLSDDWYGVDWQDPAQRATALQKGMQFYRVPRAYQLAVATVVENIMLATPDMWMYKGDALPQPWAQTCCYVIFALINRLPAVLMPKEGNTRRGFI